MARRTCDGCLGTDRCWICSGEGYHRCARTGRCHLCGDVPTVIRLAAPADEEAVCETRREQQ